MSRELMTLHIVVRRYHNVACDHAHDDAHAHIVDTLRDMIYEYTMKCGDEIVYDISNVIVATNANTSHVMLRENEKNWG